MDMMALLRQSWSLTRRRWELWLLNLAMMLVFVPALLLIAAFGGLVALLLQPAGFPLPTAMRWVERLSTGAWASIGLVAVLLLSITTGLAIMLQAGAIRLVIYSSQGSHVGIVESLHFSEKQRLRILCLGLGFGLLNGMLALLPLVVPMFVQGEARVSLMRWMQSFFSPAGTIMGVALLLLVISVAVEDLIPTTASRNFGKILREGWWGFLIVITLTMVLGIITAIGLIVPLVPLLLFGLFLQESFFLVVPCLGMVALLFIFLSLATAVYTLTLYTLVYWAAAERAALRIEAASV